MDYKRRCDEEFAKNMDHMEKINSLVNYFINSVKLFENYKLI